MDGAHHGPVTALLPQGGNGGVEVIRIDLGQHILTKVGADALQLAGDGGILVGQVSVAGPAVDDAQGMAAGRKIEIHTADPRLILMEEIDGHQAAHGRRGLIHQAAGLAEEHILGILADHGDLRRIDPAVEEQVVEDGADEHLIGRGRTEAGAGEYRRFCVGIEALDFTAQLHKPGGYAPDQRGGTVDLLRLGREDVQIHLAQGIALGLDADNIRAVAADSRPGIQVHCRGQDTTPLMVGVVAADLRPAGGRKVTLRSTAESGGEAGVQGLPLRRGQGQFRCRHGDSS